MGIDASIPLSYNPNGGLQQLSSLINLASGAQGLKGQQLQQQGMQQQNDSNAITLQERQALQGALKDPSAYTDQNGNVDYNKLLPMVMKLAPTTGAQHVQNIMAAQKAGTDAQSAINGLTTDARAHIGSTLYSIPDGTPPQVVQQTVTALTGMYKGMEPASKVFLQGYQSALAKGGQQAADQFRKQAAQGVLPQNTQQDMATPQGVAVNNGQQSAVVNVKPGASIPQGGVIPGTATQMQLPPSTPTVHPVTGQPGYVGPTGTTAGADPYATKEQLWVLNGELAKAMADGNMTNVASLQREIARVSKTPGFVPTALPPGQAQNITDNVDSMGKHFAVLQGQAEQLPIVTSLVSNIKSLANSAITGTEQGRKTYLTGLLNALGAGNKATGDIQADTELLKKQIAQLNLNTPTTTDAGKALVAAAQPNSGMSAKAINQAADQILDQIKASKAMRDYLSPAKQMGDTNLYTAQRQELESAADMRIFQLQGKSQVEQAEFMKKLSPKDRYELIHNAQKLEQMGVIK